MAATISVGPPGTTATWAADVLASAGIDVTPVGPGTAGLVWVGSHDPDGLAAALRSAPRARWVQLPSAGIDDYLGHGLLDPALACDAVTGPGRFRGLRRGPAGVAHVLYMQTYFVLGGLALGGTPVFGSAFALRATAWHAARTGVHRHDDVHDDLDLSFHLRPGSVRYDDGLAVSISARPLRTPGTMALRLARGWRSVVLHWPQQGPWHAAEARVRARARRLLPAATRPAPRRRPPAR